MPVLPATPYLLLASPEICEKTNLSLLKK